MKQTIPNLLSILRIVMVPGLLAAAWFGRETLFLSALVVALASDVADGYLARRFGVVTELGARLDSWGDMATYLSVPLCAWWLYPELLEKEYRFVLITVAAYAIPIVASVWKFRCLASYHTWSAKLSAVVMGTAVLVLFITGHAALFRAAAIIQALVALDCLLITVRLSRPQSNVKSCWHVWRGENIGAQGIRE